MRTLFRFLTSLIFCVVLFSIAAGGVADAPTSDVQESITHNENTTNYLSPAEPTDEDYARVSLDVSTAASVGAQKVHAEHDSKTFTQQRQSTNQEQEQRVTQEQLQIIADRFESLDQQQQRQLERYSSGETSNNEFFRNLVRIQAIAEHQSEIRHRIDSDADDSSVQEFQERLDSLEDIFLTRQSVTDHTRQAVISSSEPVVIYTQSADSGIVLATVEDGVYNRQATLYENRDLDGVDQFRQNGVWSGDNAFDRAEELYPWAFSTENLNQQPVVGGGSIHSQIYEITSVHNQGELTIYLDGATTDVFHENQINPTHLQPITDTISNSTDGLRVSVDLTRGTGPMRVNAEDQNGNPVDNAQVTINGHNIASTDDSGAIWTVQPRTQFEVNITTPDDDTIRITGPGED